LDIFVYFDTLTFRMAPMYNAGDI